MSRDWKSEPQSWRKSYEATGYLVVENAVDEDTLAQLRVGLERIERGVAEDTLPKNLRSQVSLERDRTKGQKMGESQSDAISNVMELPSFGPEFSDFIIYPRVLDVLEALFQSSEFSFHNYKAICKMPSNEAHFAWHRDLPYLKHTSPNLITAMICLDAMTKENGATVVCPGSHRIAHEDVKDSDTDMAQSDVPENRVTVECPAGSAVLFHVNIVHGGGPNHSDTKRRNVIGIWAGPETYPTTSHRYAYEFVAPRSRNPEKQKQIALTFGRK